MLLNVTLLVMERLQALNRVICHGEVIEDFVKYKLLLKLKKNIHEENFAVEVQKTSKGSFAGNPVARRLSLCGLLQFFPQEIQIMIVPYIASKPQHWRPSHSLQITGLEDMNKMNLGLYVCHKIFEDLGIKYHPLPQEVHVTI